MNKKSDSDFNDFLSDKAVLGCTLGSMYRNVVFKNGLPEKMKNLEYPTMEQSFRGDTFRNILHLHEGKAHCEPEADATYRITEEGLWQGINNFRRNLLNANIYKDLWIFFDKKYPEILYKSFKIFNIIKKDDEFINKLESIEDENKRSAIIKQLSELESIYNKNKEEIKASMKQSIKKLKYKIYFNIYEKIQSKLTKKGIL